MSEPFIGQIEMFAGNFAPRNWAFCDGQLLAIAQNTALFSLLGTLYGGDGRVTFGLPDLRGRLPMGWGAGAGLGSRWIGERGGSEAVTLSTAELPTHAHILTGAVSFSAGSSPGVYVGGPDVDPLQTDAAGGGQAHENLPPYLAVNFIIALQGIFPSRS